MSLLKSPVALFIYKRPSLTEQVFTQIAKVRPSTLFVVADGPLNEEEYMKIKATRAVIEQIDWDCKVITNYSDVNLGCRNRISSGLNWVFEQCEYAIILEDDCLPDPTFFLFCDELLEKYRENERIMMVGGSSLHFKDYNLPYSYFFSRFALIWGWATWRRAWRLYDIDMKVWTKLRNTSFLLEVHENESVASHWKKRLDKAFAGHSTWDHQWSLTCWLNNGFSILPSVNLVKNIGFGEDATHTKSIDDINHLSISTEQISFPLKHPQVIVRDRDADNCIFQNLFNQISRGKG